MILNYVYFDGAERNICHNFVDKIQGGGKYDTLKKVEDSTCIGHRNQRSTKNKLRGQFLGLVVAR